MEKASLTPHSEWYAKKPFIDGAKLFYGGQVREWDGEVVEVTSPIIDRSNGQRIAIGRMAQMSQEEGLKAHDEASKAWNFGMGAWPQMSQKDRIDCILRYVEAVIKKRDAIVHTLMWEICKTQPDAEAEFDRTMVFIEATIEALKDMDQKEGGYRVISGTMARVRRAAIGITLLLGAFNYPFNETYTALIPALLMGNVVIMKIPALGGLAHVLTMEAFAATLPPGVVNFIAGSSRVVVPPIMQRGSIDVFSFIGGPPAVDAIIRAHPNPHRLKIFLSLEGKNIGVVAADANLDLAASQCCAGASGYNGQRCTAIKLIFVQESVSQKFIAKLAHAVDSLSIGLPWQKDIHITPLPEPDRIEFLQRLIKDAVDKGAQAVNASNGGGEVYGNIMKPLLLAGITSEMELWTKEQFGPVVPVATYTDIEEVFDYIRKSQDGLQAAIFTQSAETAAPLIDVLSTAVGRINLNTQNTRSPDVFPFSGHRSSTQETLSTTEALRTFSIESVVATKASEENEHLFHEAEKRSRFLAPLDGAK